MNRTQASGPGAPPAVPVRRVRGTDVAALGEFFTGLSVRTRYLRFFAPVTPTRAMLRLLAGESGHVHALVATCDGAIIGHAMAADRATPDGAAAADIGVVVADAWHGQGVGSALVRTLIAGAQARGVRTVAMDVLPRNTQVLAMIAGHWPSARLEHCPDSVTIRMRLPRPRHEPLPPAARRSAAARTTGQRRPRRAPARTAGQVLVPVA